MEELSKGLGFAGSIASLVGLVITVVGFFITIWNVRKSRTAAQQAREASLKVREDIRKIDTVSDLSSAISIMHEIKRLHRANEWIILPDRYSTLKKLLISIKVANPDLSETKKKSIQATIQQMTNIDKQIEKVVDGQEADVDVPKLNAIITKQVDRLEEVLIEIRNDIGD